MRDVIELDNQVVCANIGTAIVLSIYYKCQCLIDLFQIPEK